MQRAMFAQLVLQDAAVILLDEPFNAVDARTVADLLGLVTVGTARGGRWWRSRDLPLVTEHFSRNSAAGAQAGRLGPTAEVACEAHLARAQRMIETADSRAHVCARALPDARRSLRRARPGDIMTAYDLPVAPFADFEFHAAGWSAQWRWRWRRRSGAMLMLRRMSLTGDAVVCDLRGGVGYLFMACL